MRWCAKHSAKTHPPPSDLAAAVRSRIDPEGRMEKLDILVVDDDAGIRTLLSRGLERAGMRCDLASDGADAAKRIEKTDFALVLLDLMMPRLDGVEFVERLRQRQEHGGS